jgi:transcriptional regulator with XRE-family HTH domain
VGRAASTDIDRFVGHRIKELRLLAGITQQQLAKQLGISNQQVHKIEKGTDRVSASRLLALTRAFDVAVEDFFDGYDRGAPLDPLRSHETTKMLLGITQSFVRLKPKHQDALIRLARALATEG